MPKLPDRLIGVTDPLREQIAEFVGDQVVEFGDIYEWASDEFDLTAAAAEQNLSSDEFLEELIAQEPLLFETDRGIRRLDVLLDSLVFTHRLTGEEIEESVLSIRPDLVIIDRDGSSLRTPDGRAVTNPVRDLALDGPEGWLERFSDGEVVEVRRRNGVLIVEPAGATLDLGIALAVREAFDDLVTATGDPVQQLDDVVLAVVDEADDAFRTPAAPLADLIVAAGLETQGEWIAEAGTDFAAPGSVLADERLGAVAERWGMDSCCTERLSWLLESVDRADIDEPRRVVEAMGHEAVVLGLRDMLHGSGDLHDPQLAAWLGDVIEATGRRAAPALTLRAFHHEIRGETLEAEADLEGAHALDPAFAPASVELATYLAMRNEFGRAVSLLNAIGSDGAAIGDLFGGVYLEAAGVGRNDPCPCGSGRKYKSCHLGRPITTPAAQVDAVLLKMRMFVTDLWRGAAGLPVLAFVASDGDPEAVATLFNDDFLQSLGVFEGGGILDFLDRMGPLLPIEERELATGWTECRLGLYEVVAIRDQQVTLLDREATSQVVVEDRELAAQGREGMVVLTWLVPVGTDHRIAPPVIDVSESQIQAIESLLEVDASAADWASWYGGQ